MLASLDMCALCDAFTYWLVNVSSGFMLSAAHNVLFFVLDIHTISIHFMHYLCAFVFLFGRVIFVRRGRFFTTHSVSVSRKIIVAIYPAIIGQILVSAVSAQVHSQSLIALYFGIFDFLSTLTALRTKSILLKDFEDWRRARLIWILLVPVALSSSLSWLELGHIEYDHWTLLLSPILAILQGLQFVLIKKAQMDFCAIAPLSIEAEEEDEWFEDFSMHYTGWVALILFLPSLVSYSCSVISHDAAWESIDHVLMGMSIVFMASFKYSELWLQTHLDIHHFCILEHTKFFMASCGQWFLQNMAHATIYAACGKVLFVASTFRYWSNFHGLLSSRKENEA